VSASLGEEFVTLYRLKGDDCFEVTLRPDNIEYAHSFTDIGLNAGTCSDNGFSAEVAESHVIHRIPFVSKPLAFRRMKMSTWDLAKVKAKAFFSAPFLLFPGYTQPKKETRRPVASVDISPIERKEEIADGWSRLVAERHELMDLFDPDDPDWIIHDTKPTMPVELDMVGKPDREYSHPWSLEFPWSEADEKIIAKWGINAKNEWVTMKEGAGLERCVYKVKRKGETMALKRTSFHTTEYVDQFWDEWKLKTMAKLGGKHHTMRLQEWAIEGKWAYMLMPLEHAPLLTYVKAALALGWDDSSIWKAFGFKAATEISDAIVYIHSQGLGHGDLKLDNILVSDLSSGNALIKAPEATPDLPPWIEMEVALGDEDGELTNAIKDLKSGRFPAHFDLSDFGMSRSLKMNDGKNEISMEAVDQQMWTSCLFQLWSATENLYSERKMQNRRHLINDLGPQSEFADLLQDLVHGKDDSMLKYLQSDNVAASARFYV
jgi:hypothetical protein